MIDSKQNPSLESDGNLLQYEYSQLSASPISGTKILFVLKKSRLWANFYAFHVAQEIGLRSCAVIFYYY
jgi:hypothetical protein